MLRTKLLIAGLFAFSVGGLGVAAASAVPAAQQEQAVQKLVSAPLTDTSTITPSVTVTATAPLTTSLLLSPSKKIDISIATYFSVPVTSVVQLHDTGWGYGEIYKLYAYARLSGKTPQEIQAMRESGMGWGNIAKTLNIKPGNAGDNLGGVISGRTVPTDTLNLKDTARIDKAKPKPQVQARNNQKAKKSKPAPAPKKNQGGGNSGKPGKKP